MPTLSRRVSEFIYGLNAGHALQLGRTVPSHDPARRTPAVPHQMRDEQQTPYQALVEGVHTRLQLADTTEARQVTGTVLGTLVRAVPSTARQHLLATLPPLTEAAAELGGTPRSSDAHDLLIEIGHQLHQPRPQTRHLTRAVLDEVAAHDPTLLDRLATSLPTRTLDSLRTSQHRELKSSPQS